MCKSDAEHYFADRSTLPNTESPVYGPPDEPEKVRWRSKSTSLRSIVNSPSSYKSSCVAEVSEYIVYYDGY